LAVKGSTKEIVENAYAFIKSIDDEFIDVIIHGQGNKFFLYIEKANSRGFEKISLTGKELAEELNKKLGKDSRTIRLLSCSNLEAAQDLSKSLNKRKIIASNEDVLVYHDGTVSSGQFYEIVGDSRRQVSNPNPPKASTNKGDFVRLGFLDDLFPKKKKIIATGGATGKKYTKEDILTVIKGDDGGTKPQVLYRGTTGSETDGKPLLFLTDDPDYAATYIKGNGKLVQYEVSDYGMYLLRQEGFMETKVGQHVLSGEVISHTEYTINNAEIKKIFNEIAEDVE